MTWSQLVFFDRATTYVEAEKHIVALAIAHNPYAEKHAVPRLWRAIKRQMSMAMRGIVGGKREERPLTKEQVEAGSKRLEMMFGGIKRATISREEMDRRLAGNGARKIGR